MSAITYSLTPRSNLRLSALTVPPRLPLTALMQETQRARAAWNQPYPMPVIAYDPEKAKEAPLRPLPPPVAPRSQAQIPSRNAPASQSFTGMFSRQLNFNAESDTASYGSQVAYASAAFAPQAPNDYVYPSFY